MEPSCVRLVFFCGSTFSKIQHGKWKIACQWMMSPSLTNQVKPSAWAVPFLWDASLQKCCCNKIRESRGSLALLCATVVLFVLLCTLVLSFESMEETEQCNHSNENYWTLFFIGTSEQPWVTTQHEPNLKNVTLTLKCNYENCPHDVWAVLFFQCLSQ